MACHAGPKEPDDYLYNKKKRRDNAISKHVEDRAYEAAELLVNRLTTTVKQVIMSAKARRLSSFGIQFRAAATLMEEYLQFRTDYGRLGAATGDLTMLAMREQADFGRTISRRMEANRMIAFAAVHPTICSTCGAARNPFSEPMTCPTRCARNKSCQHLALSRKGEYPFLFGGLPTCFRCAQKISLTTRDESYILDKCHILMERRENEKRAEVEALIYQSNQIINGLGGKVLSRTFQPSGRFPPTGF